MANNPSFASTPRVGLSTVSTADTSRTSPTNVVTVFTAGASGSRIDEINITATGTTTANMIRLWVYNGSTYYLFQEISVTAITPTTGLSVFQSSSTYNNFMLESGQSLRVTTNNAESYNVVAFGGDF